MGGGLVADLNVGGMLVCGVVVDLDMVWLWIYGGFECERKVDWGCDCGGFEY